MAYWILVGMMGAGKSSVGRELARISDREFKDTDQLLQNRLGRAIPRIFEIYGEAAFRDHESSILKSLQPADIVLATGGGIVMRDGNWDEMRRLGTVVFLDFPLSLITKRLELSRKRRPLLEVEDWEDRLEEIMTQRRPLYEKADIHLCLESEDIERSAEQVLAAIRSHS